MWLFCSMNDIVAERYKVSRLLGNGLSHYAKYFHLALQFKLPQKERLRSEVIRYVKHGHQLVTVSKVMKAWEPVYLG